jgi:hypothetical protein
LYLERGIARRPFSGSARFLLGCHGRLSLALSCNPRFVGNAVRLALRPTSVSRDTHGRARRLPLDECRIILSWATHELGRHCLLCIAGGAQPFTKAPLFESAIQSQILLSELACASELSYALDAGDSALREGALLLLGSRNRANSPVVTCAGCVNPQICRAGIIVGHHKHHRLRRRIFPKRVHRILTLYDRRSTELAKKPLHRGAARERKQGCAIHA